MLSAPIAMTKIAPPTVEPRRRSHVLLVDDDPHLLRSCQRAITRLGHHVTIARDGEEALGALLEGLFDIVVSDVDMPRLDGVGLLRALRERDANLPVILITGHPTMETAISAANLGVTHYLTKPLAMAELTSVVQRALDAHELNRLHRHMVETVANSDRQRRTHEARFDRAFAGLYMAFQPIVHWPSGSIHGHEALARSREPEVPHPGVLFDLAEELGRTESLGARIRDLCAEQVPATPGDSLLFVNMHAADLANPHLLDRHAPLTQMARRVVLEISERCGMPNIEQALKTIKHLRELGFRIALDDIGAGYAGLNSFALVEPDVVKLDMALVRNVQESSTKQRLIGNFTGLCRTMGIDVIAEGVETIAERDTLVELGCELFQGYLFGRPSANFASSAALP